MSDARAAGRSWSASSPPAALFARAARRGCGKRKARPGGESWRSHPGTRCWGRSVTHEFNCTVTLGFEELADIEPFTVYRLRPTRRDHLRVLVGFWCQVRTRGGVLEACAG